VTYSRAAVLLISLLALLAGVGAHAAPDSSPSPFALFPGGSADESITAPAAYSAYAGVYYVGAFGIRQVTYFAHNKRHNGDDGAVTLGAGLGQYGHGFTLTATVADLDRPNATYISAKWQALAETDSLPAVGVGMEDIFENVDLEQAQRTPYAVVSKTLWNRQRVLRGQPLGARTMLSLGYGGGRFHDELFGSAATSLSSNSEAIVEHDHWGTNLGYSLTPWPAYPNLALGFYGMRVDDPRWRTIAASATYIWAK
jgi:hypothetical protein